MSAAPVLRAATGGVTRRLVPTIVIFVVVAASTAAALLALTLVTSANSQFLTAFAQQHGADLAVTIDTAKVTSAQLAATRHLPGVTQAAGPHPETTITLAISPAPGASPGRGGPSGPRPSRGAVLGPSPGGGLVGPSDAGGAPGQPSGGGGGGISYVTVGRASSGGPLDHIQLTRGRWATRPGEIVLSDPIAPLGGKVTVTSAPGKPKLTVVGYGGSVVRDEDAWVAPSEIALLRAKDTPARVQMLYTFVHASTTTQISADLAALKAALPTGAITDNVSWLDSANQISGEQSNNTAFVAVFGIIGLVLGVLITASVVSAAVVASYRRIGVLKSIGFTPAQLSATYLAQIAAPAAAGWAAGAVVGNWWAVPLLNGGPFAHQAVPLWINITTPAGMIVLTGLAALVPALRAGRLSAVAAIAAGQAPRAGHGYRAHRLAGRLALPRPVTIGLAAPFSRPSRSAFTLTVTTFGLTAVVLAAGLASSIVKINHSSLDGLGQVQVGLARVRQPLTASQDRAIVAALRSQPGTLHYVGETDLVPMPGAHPTISMSGRPILVTAYTGDSAWLGFNLVSGHWYRSPGEVDVNTGFLALTGLKVGDTIHLTIDHKPVTARIAGAVYIPVPDPKLYTSWQTLGGAAAGLAVWHYDVNIKPGTSLSAYLRSLSRTLGPHYRALTPSGKSFAAQARPAYIRLLAVLVAILSGLGVLNSVLLLTRERVHDLGVFKALGMTPRQTIAMVTYWVAAPAISAAIIALPIGMILQDTLVWTLARQTSLGLPVTLPGSFVHVYTTAELALLALAGLAIAAVGALGPATWAAISRTTTALHAE